MQRRAAESATVLQTVFESPDGTVFQSPPGVQPERDKQGQLAYKAISYTPWPVEQGAEGDRLRLEVGSVNKRQNQTYIFERWVSLSSHKKVKPLSLSPCPYYLAIADGVRL